MISLNQDEYYEDKNGMIIKICDLDTKYLKNIICMLTTDIDKTEDFIINRTNPTIWANPFKQIRKSKLFKALQSELLKRRSIKKISKGCED